MFRSVARSVTQLNLPQRKFERYMRRCISLKADGYPADFTFYPNFFSHEEQRLLLLAALQKLDLTENRKVRRRQREFSASRKQEPLNSIEQVFLPDEYYTFEEVIAHITINFLPF